MGIISKLNVVNQMLLSSGENLVSDLLNTSGIDTAMAEVILEQASLDFQMRGLANNKFLRKMVTQANTNYLVLPTPDSDEEGVISADLISDHLALNGVDRVNTRLQSIGGPLRLWNTTDDTDVFISGVTYYVEIVSKLVWENLDTPSQRAIQATAVRNYQVLTQGDEVTDMFLSNQETIFNARGRAADINDKDRNIFSSGDAQQRQRNIYNYDPSRIRFWTQI